MLERPLRWIAIVLSLVVSLGFILFAFDDFDRASNDTQGRIGGYEVADPTPAGEREREQRNGTVREYIDDANDILLKPFAGIAPDRNTSRWAHRGVPAILALLVYGVLLGYLARYAKARA